MFFKIKITRTQTAIISEKLVRLTRRIPLRANGLNRRICSFFIIFKCNIISSMNIIQIISGLIAAALGALAVVYTEWIVQNVGYNEWAEEKMSMWGGSRMLYKIIGVLVVLGGLLYAFDLLDKFIFGIGKMFFGAQ